jgi:long-chain acyl-CoA synthetase
MKIDKQPFDAPYIASVQEMLINSALKFNDKLAMEDIKTTPIQRLTYSELLNTVLRFGKALKKLGLKERSHIAVIAENRVQWSVSYLTALCFNYVIVPIDNNLNASEILNILHESESEAVIFSEHHSSLFSDKKDSLKKLKHFISMDSEAKEDGFLFMRSLIDAQSACSVSELPKINPDEMCEIIFTSGSLGRAKGVMLSQKNISINLMDMIGFVKMYSEDRFLSVLPIHHKYECTCGMLCPLYIGASVHYARSLRTIVDDMMKVKATVFLAVPLLFDKMFKKIYKGLKEKKAISFLVSPMVIVSDFLEKVGWKNSKKVIFSEIHKKFGGSVRLFVAGGAAADPEISKGLREFGFTMIQGYGLTECSPILAVNRIHCFKDEAAGLPMPHVTLKIDNPDAGGCGEILAKAGNVMLGYYKNKAATDEAFTDGWFRTGDIGLIDEDGFLHISGRKKNVIISKSGENVFPEEVEDVLNHSPFVLESYVYGEKNQKDDEVIAAQIVPDAEAFIELAEAKKIDITTEFINQIIADEVKKTNKHLTQFKQIKKFYIHDNEFEKTTTHKIKRYLIK